MKRLANLRLGTKLLLIFAAALLLLSVGLFLVVRRAQTLVIETQARGIAETVATRVRLVRAVYTQYVVGKLQADLPGQVRATANFEGHPGEIPLPAIFVHLASDNTNATENQVSYSLISGWNINPKKGLSDDFERTGWSFLLQQQEKLCPSSLPST